jgi:hypothetical protein
MLSTGEGVESAVLHWSISIVSGLPKDSLCVKRPKRLRCPAALRRPGRPPKRAATSPRPWWPVFTGPRGAPSGIAGVEPSTWSAPKGAPAAFAWGVYCSTARPLPALWWLPMAANHRSTVRERRRSGGSVTQHVPVWPRTCLPQTSREPRRNRLPVGWAWGQRHPHATLLFWHKPRTAVRKTRGRRCGRKPAEAAPGRASNRPAMQHRDCWRMGNIISRPPMPQTAARCSPNGSKPSPGPWPPNSGRLPRRPPRRKRDLRRGQNTFRNLAMPLTSAAQVARHRPRPVWSSSPRPRKRHARSSSASVPRGSRSPRAAVGWPGLLLG